MEISAPYLGRAIRCARRPWRPLHFARRRGAYRGGANGHTDPWTSPGTTACSSLPMDSRRSYRATPSFTRRRRPSPPGTSTSTWTRSRPPAPARYFSRGWRLTGSPSQPGHIPGSGFGRIARERRRYWQTLEKSQEANLPGIDLSRGVYILRHTRKPPIFRRRSGEDNSSITPKSLWTSDCEEWIGWSTKTLPSTCSEPRARRTWRRSQRLAGGGIDSGLTRVL